MAQIGNVSASSFNGRGQAMIPIDESICGMLFDISSFTSPFANHQTLYSYFSDDNVVVINNMMDAHQVGILDDDFIGGALYYHISKYYEYLGADKPLYICISDCSAGFSAIETMLMNSNGNIFQIGVWTRQALWTSKGFEAQFSNMVKRLGIVSEEISQPDSGFVSPVNIVLCANPSFSNALAQPDYNTIPDCTDLGYSKLSICLGQKQGVAYGMLGMVMACISLAYAEESIGYVNKFNLNKFDDFYNVELGFGTDNTPIDSINRVRLNLLSQKNYIFPIHYEPIVNGTYLNCDATMSDDDYCSIHVNRVMNKFKRILKRVLTPYINKHVMVDRATGYISSADVAIMSNAIHEAISSNLINPTGNLQIVDYHVDIADSKILDNDMVKVDCRIACLESQDVIDFEEYFNIG